jgi:anti-sigma-K factor RskA
MDNQYIKSLLDRYFEGETSLDEEKMLSTFFQNSKDLPAEWQGFQHLFQFFAEEKQQTAPSNLVLQPSGSQLLDQSPKSATIISLRWARSVAAAIAILAIALWILHPYEFAKPAEPIAEVQKSKIDWSKYEPKTTEEAIQITRKAFHRVGYELNRGTRIATSNVEKMGQMGKLFN